MDILSHGLWGGVILGRKNRRDFCWAFGFGIAPDLFSFGIFTGLTILGLASSPDWSAGSPTDEMIPAFVHTLYGLTHSLIIFALVFGLVWLVRKNPFLPLLAWGFHIALDIPTHSMEFFPTPFLWPFFNNIRFNGIAWARPIIFIPDVILLVLVYSWFFVIKKKLGVKVAK